MKKTVAVFAVVVMVAFGLVALAAGPAEQKAPKPSAPQALSFKGTVTALDEAAKTLKVKDAAGKELEFSFSGAHVKGTLKVGEPVVVKYHPMEGKNVATSIHVGAAPAKK
uniref:DUF5666 domain-containing protein n=1 Tax=Thermoanaerobaculum aquaticum TaxID=1312852 RepID=A0A7C2SB11_9BACT